MICRHCRKSSVSRPRGLCWGCYYKPGVKEKYPPTSKFARRGVANISGTGILPPAPTNAAPGSPEKLAILAQRAALNMSLWHPEDTRCNDFDASTFSLAS